VEGVTGERRWSFVDRLRVDPAERKKGRKLRRKKKAEKCREEESCQRSSDWSWIRPRGRKLRKKKKLRSAERKKAVDEASVGVGSGREEES
jgi:hypothetical protein